MAEPKPLLKPLAPAATTPHVWKNGAFAEDAWRILADDAPLPLGGRGLVSLKRWRAERAALIATGLPVGLVVQPGEAINARNDEIGRLPVIALAFPKFADGRAYSAARRLREQWGYTGEIRAVGDVLLDQIPLMLRVGIDAFEIVNAPTIRALREDALPAVGRVYQPRAGARPSIWQVRAAGGVPKAEAAE